MFNITSEIIALVSILASAAVVIFTTLFTTVLGPRFQESSRRKSEKELRVWRQNEERFFNMLTFLEGFYVGSLDEEGARIAKRKFVEAYRQIWLYSPDEVIEKINDFLIASGCKPASETPQNKTAQEMVLWMRKTIYGDTRLEPEQFLFAAIK